MRYGSLANYHWVYCCRMIMCLHSTSPLLSAWTRQYWCCANFGSLYNSRLNTIYFKGRRELFKYRSWTQHLCSERFGYYKILAQAPYSFYVGESCIKIRPGQTIWCSGVECNDAHRSFLENIWCLGKSCKSITTNHHTKPLLGAQTRTMQLTISFNVAE